MTQLSASKLTIIGSDNATSPGGRQAIISTNAKILLTRPMETNFSENVNWKMSAVIVLILQIWFSCFDDSDFDAKLKWELAQYPASFIPIVV